MYRAGSAGVAPFEGVQPLGLAASAAAAATTEEVAAKLEDQFWQRQRENGRDLAQGRCVAPTVELDPEMAAAVEEDLLRHRRAVRQEMEVLLEPEGEAAVSHIAPVCVVCSEQCAMSCCVCNVQCVVCSACLCSARCVQCAACCTARYCIG